MNKTLFFDVNDTNDTWSILAKVLQKWSVKRKATPYAVWKVGMLLADEKGSRIEVFATHKNLIGKLKDEPREGMVYNFQNFQVLENDDKYRITTGDCAEETFGKKHEDMKPPITVLVRFARLNRNTDYGHLSNAFNATLVTLNPNIPEANLMKEGLSQDSLGTQLFSQVSSADYPTYSAESMLSFRTRIPLCEIAKLDQEGINSTIPKELDEIAGKLVIVKLKIKSHNIKHRTSSIGVTQFYANNNLINQFKYFNQEESTASTGNIRTISQQNVIEDGDNTVSQLTTPPKAYTKRKTLGNDTPIVYEDLGLAEICTPKMSSTKPLKNIKNEN
ncbi:hypothetical protein K1719_008721 [Acacia pycnantha]|nr:hypothetical protein K1719_008721 [Acacia pycnantha]